MYKTARPITLVDALIPVTAIRQSMIRDALFIISFVIITAAFARIAIPLPFTPVPITGQTLAVLLAGAVLGSRRGAISMTIYVVAGAWLPLYASGVSGFIWGMASGGYIVGFIPAAYVVGYLSEKGWDRRPWVILSMLAGNVLIYIPGLLQLSLFVPEGQTLAMGLYPFIPGDLIKIGVASLVLPTAWGLFNLSKGSFQIWK